MELTPFFTWTILLLASIVLNQIRDSLSAPTFSYVDNVLGSSVDRIDGGADDFYPTAYGEPLTDYRLSRLRRGYYYVDDGYISAVPESALTTATAADRRQDVFPAGSGGGTNVRFTPLVKYKQTRTKRKKLFVPNLFG